VAVRLNRHPPALRRAWPAARPALRARLPAPARRLGPPGPATSACRPGLPPGPATSVRCRALALRHARLARHPGLSPWPAARARHPGPSPRPATSVRVVLCASARPPSLPSWPAVALAADDAGYLGPSGALLSALRRSRGPGSAPPARSAGRRGVVRRGSGSAVGNNGHQARTAAATSRSAATKGTAPLISHRHCPFESPSIPHVAIRQTRERPALITARSAERTASERATSERTPPVTRVARHFRNTPQPAAVAPLGPGTMAGPAALSVQRVVAGPRAVADASADLNSFKQPIQPQAAVQLQAVSNSRTVSSSRTASTQPGHFDLSRLCRSPRRSRQRQSAQGAQSSQEA
jgi:hypothetical protein